MDSKFKPVEMDPDTQILFQEQMVYGKYDVLYQKWHWDGVTGESLVFIESELGDIELEVLLRDIEASPLIKNESKITHSKKDNGFVFFNFNFETK